MQPRENLYADRARADSFGSVARIYDVRRPRYPTRLIDDLLSQDAQTVLDVGAGTGIASEQFLERRCPCG
jgi:ubiquinone/menaquinone biosynthesis C-methylase UbiE